MDVIRARFRVTLTEVSTSFPDATLRLLTGVPKGDRALELGEVRAENAGTVAGTIARYEADERSLHEFLPESSLPSERPLYVVTVRGLDSGSDRP